MLGFPQWDSWVGEAPPQRGMGRPFHLRWRRSGLGRFYPFGQRAANGRKRLGFRMPAQRERSTRAKGAGVRKPPMKEPAGRRRAAIRREFEGPEAECLQHVE